MACACRDYIPPLPASKKEPRWAGAGLTVDDLIKLHEKPGDRIYV